MFTHTAVISEYRYVHKWERDCFDWDFSIAGDEQYNTNVCLGRQIVQFVELMHLIRIYLI